MCSTGSMDMKRSGSGKGNPPPPYGITHLRFGRKRRSTTKHSESSPREQLLPEQCQRMTDLMEKFMAKQLTSVDH